MEKLKNLFDYATSELSQDAFLCWLFENYNCENSVVRNAALELLGKMTGLENCSKSGVVTELETKRQVKNTDIVVRFNYNGAPHALIIEDKIFSGEHNQFEPYKSKIQKEYPNEQLSFAYYKTDIVNEKERSDAGNFGWKSFFLEEIYEFFQKRKHSGCLIFDQYREHICELYEKTTKLPDKPMAEWKELILFRTYIQQTLIPFVESEYGDILTASPSGWHSYSAIWIERKDDEIIDERKVKFALEICFYRDWNVATARISLRGGEIEGKNKDYFANNAFRDWAIQNLIRGSEKYRIYKDDYCLGHNKKEFLSYESGIEKVTQDCKELIEDFAKMCREMNKELPHHPDWRIFLTEREK